MIERKEFAKILIAADGYQVLFWVDIDENGDNCLRAKTLLPGGAKSYTHQVSFTGEMSGAPWQLLDALEDEQAEVIRQAALTAVPVIQ